MKKYLYLMRHGQTMFNKQHRIQGWCDSPLTDEGKKQAIKAKQWMVKNHIVFDHAYTSTSERCIDTLQLICDLPFVMTKGLKENFYGALEGENDYLACSDPKGCETYYLQFGGESSLTTRKRMLDTLTEIMEKEDHQNVFAMSHGGACFNFMVATETPWEVELKKGLGNCCLFIYSYENSKFKLERIVREKDYE